jgi:hypothetical protein
MSKKARKTKVENQASEVTHTAEDNQTMEISQAEVVPATIVESSEAQVFTAQEEGQPISTSGESQGVDGQAANKGDIQPAEKPAEKKPRVNKRPYIEFVTEHLTVGDCDRKELVKLIMEKFKGLSKGGVETFLTDAKNPKYSYFKDRSVIQHPKTAKLIFADCVKVEAENATAETSQEALVTEATTDGLQPGE